MNNNELNARLQHAVEHITDNVQYPANSSKPLNGEIVFSTDRTNFRVGDGVINGDTTTGTQYSNLPNIIPHGFYSGTAVSSTTSAIPTISNYKIKIGDYYLNTSDYHLYLCISTVSDSGATRWQDLGTLKGADGTSISIKPNAASCTNVGDGYISDGTDGYTVGHLIIVTAISGSTKTWVDAGLIQGPQGPAGQDGHDGQDGQDGADGSTWYQGTAVNATTSSIPTGIKVGDYYLNTSTLDVWKCVSTTASTKWSLVCNIRGSKWFTGSGVPSTVVDSKIGDYYLNSSDGGVWEKTGETAWTYRTNIMGASGADGATWHSGTDVTSITSNVPSGVVVGDYYLNTNTYNVYKCISTTDSTKWSLECNIKGSQGNPGSNGNSVFISYSENADGNPNHPTFTTGDKYIGIYVGQSAPSSYTGYSWAKFVGEDGNTVQSDWNQSDSTADDYIKNKPALTSGYFYKKSGTSKFSIYIDSILSTMNTKKGIVVNLDTIISESPTGTTLLTGELGFIFGRNIFSSLSIGQEFQIIFNGTFPSGYSSLALIFPAYSIGWSNYVITPKGAWDTFYTNYKIIRRDGTPVVNNDCVFLLTITKIAGSPDVFMINTKS